MDTRLLADSGFFHMDFIRWLIWREIEFYIVVTQLVHIPKLVLRIGTWREISPNVAVGETFLPLIGNCVWWWSARQSRPEKKRENSSSCSRRWP